MTIDPRQRLEEGISHLLEERKIISGIAVSYGDLAQGEAFSRGNLREVRLQPAMLREIIRYGLPSGVQNSIIAFANVIVQSNINVFGPDTVAGCGTI